MLKHFNLRPTQVRNGCERVHDLILLRPKDALWKRLRSAGNVARRESENNIPKPLQYHVSRSLDI
jgi:hypothetical protein